MPVKQTFHKSAPRSERPFTTDEHEQRRRAFQPQCAMSILGYTTNYLYTPLGLKLSCQGADIGGNPPACGTGGQARSFTYTSLGRMWTATNPESGTITCGYDENGNLTSRTDARNVAMTALYDSLNRVTSRTYNDGTPAARFCYDGATWTGTECGTARTVPNIGLLTSAVSLTAEVHNTTRYSYNLLGQPTSTTQTTDGDEHHFITDYTHNLAGNVKTITCPSLGGAPRRTVTWNYKNANPAGQLDTVTGVKNGENKTYLAASTYAPFGGLASRQIGDPLTPRYQHVNLNSRFQATEIGLGTSGTDSSLFRLQLGYHNNGNVQGQTINNIGATQRYAYDSMNRLAVAVENPGNGQAQCPNPSGSTWCEAYSYDDADYGHGRYGNRWVSAWSGLTQASLVVPTSSAWFDYGTNRLSGSHGTYDAAGNLLGSAGWTFSYDAENRMRTASLYQYPGNNGAYAYDGEGRRVVRNAGGVSNTYIYDAFGRLAAEYQNGALLKEFIYLNGKLLAVELKAWRGRAASTEYVTTDHLGSTRVVTDSAGTVVSRHDYLPFGKEVPLGGSRTTAIGYISPEQERVLQRFTGKELDPETGLDYFGARYFSGRQGRFTTVDPLLSSGRPPDPQSWNRYAYVLNNPLRFTDPIGLYVWDANLGGNITDEEVRKNYRKKEANKIIDRRTQIRNAFAAGANIDGVSAAIAAYGVEGKANGVTVASGKLSGTTAGQVTAGNPPILLSPDGKTATANVVVTFGTNQSGNDLIVDAAHEGQHVLDRQTFVGTVLSDPNAFDGPLNITKYQTEVNAYTTGAAAFRALNPNAGYSVGGNLLWNPGWAAVDRQALDKLLAVPKSKGGNYGVTPQDPGPVLYPK